MIKVRGRREMKEGPSQARSAHNHVRGVSGPTLWVREAKTASPGRLTLETHVGGVSSMPHLGGPVSGGLQERPEALLPPVQPSLTPLLFNSNTVVEDLPCSWNCVNTWQTSYFTLPTTLSLGTVILLMDTLGGRMSCPR